MKRLLSLLLLVLALPIAASTLDEIAALEKHKAVTNTSMGEIPQKMKLHSFRLSTGRGLNITSWQIVHFMKSDCQYCQHFNPVLNATAQQLKIPVFVYSFDGLGDSTFSTVLPVTPEVIGEFSPELPQVTPTDFIVNTKTLVAIPVSQGMMSATAFVKRLEQSFRLAENLGALQ